MNYLTDREIDKLSGEAGERLRSEKKVLIRIMPRENGANAPWEGGLNGWFFRIPRGIPVEVPESLAKLIRENECTEALAKERLQEYRGGRGKRLRV